MTLKDTLLKWILANIKYIETNNLHIEEYYKGKLEAYNNIQHLIETYK